ncbi:hypothetical protein [Bradyrhizobium sp. CCGE-LA001]|uniref:hypothetical protein n=1 Tax=Bradyrhizobium sp. CCGE-LA001 TaxID=1223566 RepID=UPI0002AA7154|nr:hypothetical protein [Bradyrhizobium sp. CCGE-LA001]AMA60043.1 hypothetical protein BCCGELA001_29935 [Bradyrhizobium sp. CCGE-LA001]
MTVAQWAFWLAMAAFVAASGKFLDDYHLKAATKTKMREALVKWFIWLEAHKVPDLGGVILKGFRVAFRVRLILLVAMSFAAVYWATLSTLYLVRRIFGPEINQSYVNYLLNWVPLDESAPYWAGFLTLIIVPQLLGLLVMARLLHDASLTDSDASRLVLLVSGLVSGMLLGLLGGVLSILAFGPGPYGAMIFVAGLASILVPVTMALLTLLLIFVRYGIKLVRLILLEIFDVASSPAVSPFTYATSLLGVVILAAKAGQAAVTG